MSTSELTLAKIQVTRFDTFYAGDALENESFPVYDR